MSEVQLGSVTTVSPKRKRKAASSTPPPERRRLARTHEACARCRAKKVKCDSMLPRCTACQRSGNNCEQEDRNRNTTILRSTIDDLVRQLSSCETILKSYIPGFDLKSLSVPTGNTPDPFINTSPLHFMGLPQTKSRSPAPGATPTLPISQVPPQASLYSPGPVPLLPPFYPETSPASLPYRIPQAMTQVQLMSPQAHELRSNDLSNIKALMHNFDISTDFINKSVPCVPPRIAEDVSIDVRISFIQEGVFHGLPTFQPEQWVRMSGKRSIADPNPNGDRPSHGAVQYWLPTKRWVSDHLTRSYFSHLHPFRPVFDRNDFETSVRCLYEGTAFPIKGSFLVCLYVVLALATLVEQRLGGRSDILRGWPGHSELFAAALSVNDEELTPVTIQAHILIHQYLSVESSDRTLWRLVGSLVRLSVEVGLHNNPIPLVSAGRLTEHECQHRIRLWSIVMSIDRETSIISGLPLSISPSDIDTPPPSVVDPAFQTSISPYFISAHFISQIQAEIVNVGHTPLGEGACLREGLLESLLARIDIFDYGLSQCYASCFGLHSVERVPVSSITDDQALSLSKLSLTRLLLLRALFGSETVSFGARRRSLWDASVTAYNAIILQTRVNYTSTAGLLASTTSLRIAMIVLLYGHRSLHHSSNYQLSEDNVRGAIRLAHDLLPMCGFGNHSEQDVFGLVIERIFGIPAVDIQPILPPYQFAPCPKWNEEDDHSESEGA